MATFVLVPGGGLGGWCWTRVAPRLRAAGNAVYTPTLTGLGERAHLLTPAVGLETHIQDVLALLYYEDLTDVVLVGHSYAGMVITGVADRATGRLARLVYLDAVVPRSGESNLDLLSPQGRDRIREQVRMAGDGWRLPGRYIFEQATRAGDWSDADVAWARARFCDQPFPPDGHRLWLRSAGTPPLPRTYIRCARSPVSPSVARVRDEPGWCITELDSAHYPMITHPRETADLLLDVV